VARFEITISNGESILVDLPVADITALAAALVGSTFLVGTEVKPGSMQMREVIVASGQVTLARPADAESRQGSTFRPKR
jgi:hypothetical protein